MIQKAITLVDLYKRDETAWLEAMAELLQQGRLDEIHYAHLQEYLSDWPDEIGARWRAGYASSSRTS